MNTGYLKGGFINKSYINENIICSLEIFLFYFGTYDMYDFFNVFALKIMFIVSILEQFECWEKMIEKKEINNYTRF